MIKAAVVSAWLVGGVAGFAAYEGGCSLPSLDGVESHYWVEMEGQNSFYATVANSRKIVTPDSPKSDFVIGEDMHMIAFCVNDYWSNYSCVVGCQDNELTWDLCGPGGELGKGEEWYSGTCIEDPYETGQYLACKAAGIDFTSDETMVEWPCLDEESMGETCSQSFAEFWQITYDYAVETFGRQLGAGKGYRVHGDIALFHADSNIVGTGLIMTPIRETDITIFRGKMGPLFSQHVGTDFYATICDYNNNGTHQEYLAYLSEELGGNFVFNDSTTGLATNCANYFKEGGEFSGYIDLATPITLFAMTSSDLKSLGETEGPKLYSYMGYADDMLNATFDDSGYIFQPDSLEWQPADFDPSEAEGDVFFPELLPKWHCIVETLADDFCVYDIFINTGVGLRGLGLIPWASKTPESYTFDTPIQLNYVGIITDYTPCTEDGDDDLKGVPMDCLHMHQAMWHIRNGNVRASYPTLLDGTPDYFGVCTTQDLAKAVFTAEEDNGPEGTPPGIYARDTDSADFEAVYAAGGYSNGHMRSWGLHLCINPFDVYNPIACTINYYTSGFPHLDLGSVMLITPVSFNYEAVADRSNNCIKMQKKYCPFDDYWYVFNESTFPLTLTPVNDFAAAQADCIENGNCDPSGTGL